MAYQNPRTVISPKSNWRLIGVIYDGGKDDTALAVGYWDDRVVLGLRWNGGDSTAIGNPQSRGLPTWFILPGWAAIPTLDAAANLSKTDQRQVQIARNLLSL